MIKCPVFHAKFSSKINIFTKDHLFAESDGARNVYEKNRRIKKEFKLKKNTIFDQKQSEHTKTRSVLAALAARRVLGIEKNRSKQDQMRRFWVSRKTIFPKLKIEPFKIASVK